MGGGANDLIKNLQNKKGKQIMVTVMSYIEKKL